MQELLALVDAYSPGGGGRCHILKLHFLYESSV